MSMTWTIHETVLEKATIVDVQQYMIKKKMKLLIF